MANSPEELLQQRPWLEDEALMELEDEIDCKVAAISDAVALYRAARGIAESLFDREIVVELSLDERDGLTPAARDAVVDQIVEHLMARGEE